MRQLKSLQMIRRKHDKKVETKTTCQNAKQQQQQQQKKSSTTETKTCAEKNMSIKMLDFK